MLESMVKRLSCSFLTESAMHARSSAVMFNCSSSPTQPLNKQDQICSCEDKNEPVVRPKKTTIKRKFNPINTFIGNLQFLSITDKVTLPRTTSSIVDRL
jgi:hypothetical protein